MTTRATKVEVFHPALPSPLYPNPVKPVVLTPEVTAALNEKIYGPVVARDEPQGTPEQPYVYFALSDQDWLTLGQYMNALKFHIEALREVIKTYGHPVLNPPEEEPDSQE